MLGRYRVAWAYASSYGGPWRAGDVVELDEATAAAVSRDSPGVLVETPPPAPPRRGEGSGEGPSPTRRRKGSSDGE